MDNSTESHLNNNAITLTGKIVAAYVSNNPIPAAELPTILRAVHYEIGKLLTSPQNGDDLHPAVSVRKSIEPDFLVCLEDGKKLKMLKRYLRTHYGMTPDEYRIKWGLPSNYPMVAPNYTHRRSALAKKIGLGRISPRKKARRAGK